MYSVFIDDEMRDLIPALLPEEYELLRSSIIAEGCRDAILVWNGMIVDGHNRYRICTECGIEYETKEMAFDNRQDAILWILRNQLGRRNINAWQRSQIALKMEPMIAEKAKQQQLSTLKQNTTVLPTLTKRTDPIDTRSEIATIANVSTGTMAKVKKIINTATPETIQKLNAGEITINQAYKDVKREERKADIEKQRDLMQEIGQTKESDIDFRLGDFFTVLDDIPDGTLDCIITDPPYPREYLPQWLRLAEFAAKKLKPGGFCIAYSGQMYLPDVMSFMGEHLDYYWTFAVYHEGNTQIVNGVNLMCRWKPVLIFQNGKSKLKNTFQDYFISESREKDGHDWQQSLSGVNYLVEMFTEVNDLICDPFAGSGTTIKSAQAKCRRIIAAEIDERTYNIAKAGL
jgi:16S rRNA G966 N2-methylase RsmD